MGEVIIKPFRDKDAYVLWSTSSEVPTAYGTRAEMFEYLGGNLQAGECPTCKRYLPANDTPEARLDRTDLNGSSMLAYKFGWWDDDEFLYAQAGMLRREDLAAACELLAQGRDDEVLTLLQPFEDSA